VKLGSANSQEVDKGPKREIVVCFWGAGGCKQEELCRVSKVGVGKYALANGMRPEIECGSQHGHRQLLLPVLLAGIQMNGIFSYSPQKLGHTAQYIAVVWPFDTKLS
jgi:hypothetical protein